MQVGPLTFAVSIQDAPAPPPGQAGRSRPPPRRHAGQAQAKASPDDSRTTRSIPGCSAKRPAPPPDQPTAVYGGDTITIAAFKDAQAPEAAAPARPRTSPPRSPATTSTSARPRKKRKRKKPDDEEVEFDDEDDDDDEDDEDDEEEESARRGVHGRIEPVLRRQEGPERAGQGGRQAGAPESPTSSSRTAATPPTRSSAN